MIRIIAIVLLIAVNAFSQPQNCVFDEGVLRVVRNTGRSELVGDVLIRCPGGIQGPTITTFRVTLNTKITSKIITGDLTEALLLINEPNNPQQNQPPTPLVVGTTAFQGRLVAPNTLEFPNVSYSVRSNGVTFRIANIRADASAIAGGDDPFSEITTSQIIGRVTASNFSLPKEYRGAFTAGSYVRGTPALGRVDGCVPQNVSLLASPSGSGTVSFTADIASHKAAIRAAPAQNIAGYYWHTESGFFDASLSGTLQGAGSATQGTRLLLTLDSVPPDVSVFVTTTDEQGDAALISGGPYDGGPYTPLPATGSTTFAGKPVGIRRVSVTNGVAQALWEFERTNPGGWVRFGVLLAYQSPVQGTLNVGLSYTPLVPPTERRAPTPDFWRT